jgi:signal transduction histidine kinase
VRSGLDSGYDRRVKTGSSRGAFAIDLVVCAVLLGVTVPATMGIDAPDDFDAGTDLDTVLLPAVVLPILLRRRWPLLAAAAFAAGCVVSGIPTFDQFRLIAAVPAAMLIVFSGGARLDRARAMGDLALVLAGLVVIGLTDVAQRDEGGVVSFVAFCFPLALAAWGAGRLVRSREVVAAQLEDRTRALERRREQTAELAVEVERTRLASDLDRAARIRVRDIVELAERAPGEGSQDARATFARIERGARESLNEMRGLLGVLRGDERSGREPRPTLAQVDTLLADARAGGRLVDLEVEGERRPLPGGVELAAYRALQHGLVAVRGAAGDPATVQLRYRPDGLWIEVRGLEAESGSGDAALAAARERITAQGGSFFAETPRAGRRVVRAHLPLVAADA